MANENRLSMTREFALPDARRYRALTVSLARDWYGLPLAWLIGLVSALIYVSRPEVLFPIFDDSFISLTFARNLAEHGILSFDGESWSTGATSPLHVFTMAVLLKLGLDSVLTGVYIGVVSHAFLAAGVYLLAWSILRVRWAALLAAVAISFNNYTAMDAGNGLETSMFMALMTFAIATFFLGKTPAWRLTTGLLTALCMLTRPEAAFLVPAFVAYRWFERSEGESLQEFARDALLLAGPATATFALTSLYAFMVNGSPGGTAGAKLQFFQEDRMPLGERIGLAGDKIGLFVGPLIALIALALLAERKRHYVLFALFWLPIISIYTLTFPGGLDHYFYRYQHPVLPLLAVIAAGGVLQMVTWGMRNGVAQKVVVVAALLVAVVAVEQHYERWRTAIYSQAAYETRVDLAGMAQYLNTIVKPGETLATHDIGAVGYYAEYPVIDLVGLVNPDVLPFQDERRLRDYMEQVRPNYLLMFPEWDYFFLHLYPGDDPRYELIEVFPGQLVRTSPYLLYRINWDLDGVAEPATTLPANP